MLKNLLSTFLVNDNIKRSDAEQVFTTLKVSNPRDTILGLIEIISETQVELRALATILIRGITIREPEMWTTVSKSELDYIRSKFLKMLEIESSMHIRRKLIDCGMLSKNLP